MCLKFSYLWLSLWLIWWLVSSSPSSLDVSSSSAMARSGNDANNYLIVPATWPAAWPDPDRLLPPNTVATIPALEASPGTVPHQDTSTPGGLRTHQAASDAPTRIRVWVTHYALEGITASGSASAIGHAASYPVRNSEGRIVAANLRVEGMPVLQFGTVLAVEKLGPVTLMDTGPGMPDGRPWLDIRVATEEEAIQQGAGWQEITIEKDTP